MTLPRPRTSKRHTPPYCEIKGNWWYHRPYLGKGKFGPRVRLCLAESTDAEVWEQYRKIRRAPVNTLAQLLDAFTSSGQFKQRAPATQNSYRKCAERIKSHTNSQGLRFGDADAKAITPGTIRKYLDLRPPVAGNREVALLSVAYGWAYERDIVQANPAKGVRKATEKPRTLYVTDDAYEAIRTKAINKGALHVAAAMEIAYLCRARLSEVLALTERDCTSQGLHLKRLKGSDTHIIAWSDRLHAALDMARRYGNANVASIHLFRTRRGHRLQVSSLQSAWQRLEAPFRFHDIKAKGVSDFDGDRRLAAGHRTESAAAIYDRALKTVPATR